MSAALPAGTYMLANGSAPILSGADSTTSSLPIFPFAKADYEVANKTQKLRLRVQIATNATKPTTKFTFGLYPVTVAGGSGELKATLGTVVSGSTFEINEPAASTITSKETADFTIPADGAYSLGVVTGGELNPTPAVRVKVYMVLQTRNV